MLNLIDILLLPVSTTHSQVVHPSLMDHTELAENPQYTVNQMIYEPRPTACMVSYH